MLTQSQKPRETQFILLPEAKEHPVLLISKERLHYPNQYNSLAYVLGHHNDQDFIGNINWEQAKQANASLGFHTPSPIYLVEYLRTLLSGNIYDGTGKKLCKQEIGILVDDILTKRGPCREEHLDARFTNQNNNLMITYTKCNPSGIFTEVTEELDPDTLMKDKLPGISLDDWLINATSQGLPRINTKEDSLWYHHPSNDRVARFSASSTGISFDCYRYHQLSYSELGVRSIYSPKTS